MYYLVGDINRLVPGRSAGTSALNKGILPQQDEFCFRKESKIPTWVDFGNLGGGGGKSKISLKRSLKGVKGGESHSGGGWTCLSVTEVHVTVCHAESNTATDTVTGNSERTTKSKVVGEKRKRFCYTLPILNKHLEKVILIPSTVFRR